MSKNEIRKQETITVKPSELEALLTAAVLDKEPVLVTGAPGIGKTDIICKVAEKLGYDLIIDHPSVSEPIDYKGLPGIVGDHAEFLPYGMLRKIVETDKPTILFFDDVGQAPPAVQAALMQLILAREVCGQKVSDHVVMIAATNRKEDRCGVTGILEAVKSRFTMILELAVDTNEWCRWAISNNVAPEVIAFVRFKPAALHDFSPTSSIVNQPSPRTIAKASKLFLKSLGNGLEYKAIAGAVGKGWASEFLAFVKLSRDLPRIDAILLNPDKAKLPKQPETCFTIATGLALKASQDNLEQIITYLNRLEAPEYLVLCIKDALHRDESISECDAFIRLASDPEFNDLIGVS